MTVSFLMLPVEMRLHLYNFMGGSLRHISLCCKQCYSEVKPLLWQSVCVPYVYSYDYIVDYPNLDHNLDVYTNNITFSCAFEQILHRNFEEEDSYIYSKTVIRPFINLCGLDSLTLLHVEVHFTSEDLKWTFNGLQNLRDLVLSHCSEFGSSAWKGALGCAHLRSITLNDCFVTASEFKEIVKLTQLKQFSIFLSQQKGCSIVLEDVFALTNIEDLSIMVPGMVEYFPLSRYMSYELDKLKCLVHLNLSWTCVNDAWLAMFVECAEHLQRLVCRSCRFLTDGILEHLCGVASLVYVDVRFTRCTLFKMRDFAKLMHMREVSNYIYSKPVHLNVSKWEVS